MPRLAYPAIDAADLQPLVMRIIAERGEVLDLYRMLLHAPAVAEGWLALLTAIRQRTSLPPAVREMIIIRIAHLNGASYEAAQHIPIARRAGVSAGQIAALDDWPAHRALFAAPDRAALALTDAMTRDVRVDGAVWAAARAQWDDAAIVELAATIAAYNMVSRFLEALGIHAPAPADGDGPAADGPTPAPD